MLEGFKGLKGIMTRDAYDSYYRQLNTTNQLKGGRFRPLSIITFAVEQQFLGAVRPDDVDSVLKQAISYGVSGPNQKVLIHNMNVRHVFNVLWYMLGAVVLLYFLRYIPFAGYPLVAFVATLIFTAHPIHTEVVANVKSRDEIMSLLFMCLTFVFSFKYEEEPYKKWLLGLSMLSFFCAFLSKEYAITMMALLPLAFYIFRGYSLFRSLGTILPHLVVFTIYLAVRLYAVTPHEEDGGPNAGMILAGLVGAGFAIYTYMRPAKAGKTDLEVLFSRGLFFLPYFLIAALYLYNAYDAMPPVVESAGKEVLNNPYVYATEAQKKATEISSSLYYIKFLFFPHPLSADYSYAQIPYKDFSHWSVWLSALVHIGIVALMFLFLPKHGADRSVAAPKQATGKAIICFAVAFYMTHLLLVNNLVFDIGATLGERLIYHSSVGFAMIIAWLLVKGTERIQPAGQTILAGAMVVIIGLFGFKTIDRNQYWKNDSSLFSEDIKTVPNSVLVNANVAASYITLADYAKDEAEKKKYLTDAVKILDHTLTIHDKFVAAYLNRAIAWYKLGDMDKSEESLVQVKRLYPTYPTLPGMYKLLCDHYLKIGWDQHGKMGDYAGAIEVYKKGLRVDSTNVDLWYNMGGAFYTNKQFPEAVACFQHAVQLDPKNPQVRSGLNAAMAQYNQVQGQMAQQPRR